ncbi:MAG: hypothetical protein JW818_15815 [Pirellulales bacterium]|nr:hypothetical protein [Pirellulales bacterium]
MKVFFRIVSILFGIVGVIEIMVALGPMGSVLRHVFDPGYEMIIPTAGETFLVSVRGIADAAAPVIACFLFWYTPGFADRYSERTPKQNKKNKTRMG